MPTALAAKLHQVTDELELSQEEVATIVGSSTRTVNRWSSQGVTPQKLSRRRLVELAAVAEALTSVMRSGDAHLWLMSPNRLLGHDTPAERIRDGDYRKVLDLIDALADGIVV